MKRLALLAVLFPIFAFAQGVGGSCRSPSALCAARQFNLLSGNTLCFDSTACTATMMYNGTVIVSSKELSAQGYGNNGSGGANQGLSFSGANTFLNAAGDAFIVGINNASGHMYSLHTFSGIVNTPAVLPIKRSFYWVPPLNASTAFNAVGGNAWAVTGTPTAAPTADSTMMMVKYTSGAVSGNTAGVTGAALLDARFDYAPRMTFTVRTDSAVTSQRIFVGLTSADPSGVSTLAGLNASRVALFRYDSGIGDTNWMAVTSDGATASATDTGIAVTANTTYVLTVDTFQSGHAKFFVNSTYIGITVDKTSNIPTGVTDIGPCASITTLTTAAKALYIAKAQQDQN